MTNKQYLVALKKALTGMDKQAKDEILKEIESHAEESEALLMDHFGSVEALAQEYLDGEALKPGATQKVANVGKKVLLWLGGVSIALIGVFGFTVWIFSGDDFDYANDNNVSTMLDKTDGSWQKRDWNKSLTLEVRQARAVIYWHDEKVVLSRCESQTALIQQEDSLLIERNKCFVYLPLEAKTMTIVQASVVMIEPQASLDISVYQSNLRIAEKGQSYQYSIESNSSSIAGFHSDDSSPYTLTIKANEANVDKYVYE